MVTCPWDTSGAQLHALVIDALGLSENPPADFRLCREGKDIPASHAPLDLPSLSSVTALLRLRGGTRRGAGLRRLEPGQWGSHPAAQPRRDPPPTFPERGPEADSAEAHGTATMSVVSFNVNGVKAKLADGRRRALLMRLAHEHDLILLQETHLTDEELADTLRPALAGTHHVLASPGTSASCGVAILARRRVFSTATLVHADSEGRVVCADLTGELFSLRVSSCYFPSHGPSRRLFCAELSTGSLGRLLRGSLMGADANEVLRPQDAVPPLSSLPSTSVEYRACLRRLSLGDALAHLEESCAPELVRTDTRLRDMTRVTRRDGRPDRGRRIDVILASREDLHLCRLVDTMPEYSALSDHRPVLAQFVLPNYTRGPGYYRVDASLVADEEQARAFDEFVRATRRHQYRMSPDEAYEELATKALPKFFRERSAERAAKRRASRERLQLLADAEAAAAPGTGLRPDQADQLHALAHAAAAAGRHFTGTGSLGQREAPLGEGADLGDAGAHGPETRGQAPSETRYNETISKLMAVEAERGGQWAALRHRARSAVPSAESSRLIKGRQNVAAIGELTFAARPDSPAHTAKGATEVAASYAGMVANMMTKHATDTRKLRRVVKSLVHQPDAWQDIPNPRAGDIRDAAFAQRLPSAPGIDGLPTALYRVSLQLCDALARCIRYCLKTGRPLPPSLVTSVIRPLPKGGRKASALVNASAWRPVSLISTGYKLLERFVLTHIEGPVAAVADWDQRGFIRGRHIYENITQASLVQQYCRATGEHPDALLLLLDFDSAFCRMCTNYTRACFKRLGAPASFFPLFDLLLRGRVGRVNVNGFLSASFPIAAGASQGGVLSPIFFGVSSLGFITLLRSWRWGHGALGLEIRGNRYLTSMFADDTAVFIDSLPQLRELLRPGGPVDVFVGATNMRCQHSKTICMQLGRNSASGDRRLDGIKYLEYGTAQRHLGGFINADSAAQADLAARLATNDAMALEMDARLDARNARRDPVWRARMHSSFLLPRFAHLAFVMSISDKVIADLDRQHRAFVLKNIFGVSRPATAAATNTVACGGLGMLSARAWVGARTGWTAVRLLEGALAPGHVDVLSLWGIEHAWRMATGVPPSAAYRPTLLWPDNPAATGITAACAMHWLSQAGLHVDPLAIPDTGLCLEDIVGEPVWGNPLLGEGFFPPKRGSGHGEVAVVGDLIVDGAWACPPLWSESTMARFLHLAPDAWHDAISRTRRWRAYALVNAGPPPGHSGPRIEGHLAVATFGPTAVIITSEGSSITVSADSLSRSYTSLGPGGIASQRPVERAHWDVDALRIAGGGPVRGCRVRELYAALQPGWGVTVRRPTGRPNEIPFPHGILAAATADTRLLTFAFRFVQGKLPAGRIVCRGDPCPLCGAERALMIPRTPARGLHPVLEENRHDVSHCRHALEVYALVAEHARTVWHLHITEAEFRQGHPDDAHDGYLLMERGWDGHQASVYARLSIIVCSLNTVWVHARAVEWEVPTPPVRPPATLATQAIRRVASNAALLAVRQGLRTHGPTRRPGPCGSTVSWPRPKPQWWDGWTEGPGGRWRLNRPFCNPWPLLEAEPDGRGSEGEAPDEPRESEWESDDATAWEAGRDDEEDGVPETDFTHSPWLRGS